MPNNEKTRGGSSDQHSKAGQKSRKDMPGQQQQEGGMKGAQQGSGSTRGGTSQQHSKAGQQSHKNK